MSCCKKRGQKKIKRYSQNRIIPYGDSITIREYTEKINNEIIKCHYCQRKYKLIENKISIHCSSCDQLFHCHIAGECLGDDCTHIIQGIKRHEMYCKDCCGNQLNETQCLCKSCYKKSCSTLNSYS